MIKKRSVCLRWMLLFLFQIVLTGGPMPVLGAEGASGEALAANGAVSADEGASGEALAAKEETQQPELTVIYFYQNVCASCDGDAEFFRLYQQWLTPEEQEQFEGSIASYNVFLDSCKEKYQQQAERLGIPEGTSLPVLVVGDRWVSGLDQMEALLQEEAAEAEKAQQESGEEVRTEAGAGDAQAKAGIEKAQTEAEGGKNTQNVDAKADAAAQQELVQELLRHLTDDSAPVVVLFTTENCTDCEQAKEWLQQEAGQSGGVILTYNIIRDPCLEFLKCMFREYEVAEQEQKVPALFYGDQVVVRAEQIRQLSAEALWGSDGNVKLGKKISAVHEVLAQTLQEQGENGEAGAFALTGEGGGGQSLLTLAGAGLLAGFNPCSISMLLMLLSMVAAERASVFKSGLLYLAGKYVVYVAIGLIFYTSAAGLSDFMLSDAGRVLDLSLVLLFAAAGVLYLIDAIRVFRQDYGGVKTQLPKGLRKWNHNLIRRAVSYGGIFKPLLILGLGMAISVGEFFCTGQIYMASITYLLKVQAAGVWIYFLVYVTAMSLPALLMLLVIQKTRNTERVSEFMLRHMGAVKVFNALLFLAYAVYFMIP